MKLILLCFVLTLTSLSVHALSCLPCDKVTCAKPTGCPGGLTDDVCGCCKVCARVYNETCGGPWNSTGTCDSGLFCSKDPGLDEIASFTADGRCECKSPRVLSSCGSCLATCDNPSPHCEGDCEEGCVCPEGMIQKNSTNTTCVKMSECSECEYPKVFSACNGHCPRTCNNRFPICIAVCRAGCVCPEEMVQKSLDDTTCIWESECPKCKPPKVFVDCNSDCEPACDNPYPICNEACNGGCICPEGMILKSITNNTCISKAECQESRCEIPRVYSRCGGGCFPTCDDDPTPSCKQTCTEGCVCPHGMIQKSWIDTTCIEKDKCSNLCADPKVFTYCNGNCHATCEDPSPECPEICMEGCVCPYGMVLNPKDDTCISMKECPHTEPSESDAIVISSSVSIFIIIAICITISLCIMVYIFTHKRFSVSKCNKHDQKTIYTVY